MPDDSLKPATKTMILDDGTVIIKEPKSVEEVLKACEQHFFLIVAAYLEAADLVQHVVHKMPEIDKPKGMRLLADTWRHLDPEEKAANLLSPFVRAAEIAQHQLTHRLHASAKTINDDPISKAKN